jgi:hypothetical protein
VARWGVSPGRAPEAQGRKQPCTFSGVIRPEGPADSATICRLARARPRFTHLSPLAKVGRPWSTNSELGVPILLRYRTCGRGVITDRNFYPFRGRGAFR